MPLDPERRDVATQIRNFFRILREQKWLVLACLVLTTVAAGVYVSVQEEEYEATAKVLLQQENLSAVLVGTVPASGDPVRQAATDRQLAALPEVSARAARRLGLERTPLKVFTNTEGDSNVVSVTAQDRDPKLAARFANTYALEYIVFRRDAQRRRYEQALKIVKTRVEGLSKRARRSAQGKQLREQVKQLKLITQLQTGDAQVIQPAGVPAEPFKPEKTRAFVLGAIFGLLLGIALAVLRDKLDRRIKHEDQLQELLPGTPLIGSIPAPRRGKKGRAMVSEGFHTLQAGLGLLSPAGRLSTVLVTSAMPGEGKSTVSANLAMAIREHGRSTVLLEADLRHPALSARLGINGDRGISRILAGDGTFAESLCRTVVEPRRNGKGPAFSMFGELELVPAGPVPPNPQVLIEEHRVEVLLRQARAHSDTVIVDGPPMGMFSDMLPVAKQVDGVIVTVRLYHSRKDEVKRFAERLESAGIKPIGVVVLGTGQDLGYYGYGY